MRRMWSLLAVASLGVMSLAWTQENAPKTDAPQEGAYTLRVNVKEGEVYKYKLTMDIDFGGQLVVFSATIVNKVLKVDSEGNYTMESAQENGMVKFGDQEMPAPASPATKITYRPNGSVLKVEGEGDRMAGTFGNYHFPDKPVKVGDKWEQEVKPSEQAPKIKSTYEVVGTEKIGDYETVKIKVSGKSDNETQPMSFDGHVWVDIKTGMAVRTVMTIKGLPAEGAPMPIDGTLKMELVK